MGWWWGETKKLKRSKMVSSRCSVGSPLWREEGRESAGRIMREGEVGMDGQMDGVGCDGSGVPPPSLQRCV